MNTKWISTIKNIIADKISRLKKLNTGNPESPSSPTYNFTNLQQEHQELEACTLFQPSQKLVLLLWHIIHGMMSRIKSDSEFETTRFTQAVYVEFYKRHYVHDLCRNQQDQDG